MTTSTTLPRATKIGLNLLALLGGIIALYLGRPVFIPLVIAAMLAFILWPAVRSLQKRGMPKFFACLLVVMGVVVFNIVLFLGMASTVPRMLQELPRMGNSHVAIEEQKAFYLKLRAQLNAVTPGEMPENILPSEPERSQFYHYLHQTMSGDYVTNLVFDIGSLAAVWFWQAVLILFVLLFLLHEGEMLARQIREIFHPGEETQQLVEGAIEQIGRAVRDYLIWRTLVNVGLGIFLGLFYQFVFDLPQAWTWALLTMILCYVPYLGTIAAGIPPAIDAFINASPAIAVIVVLFYVTVVTLEGYILIPMVMGRSMDLNATTVILSCIFWELVWGLPGLFLAMPLMASVKSVCMHVDEWKPWGKLMSTEKGIHEAKMRERVAKLSERLADIGDETTQIEDGT